MLGLRRAQAALEECQDNLARLNGVVASSALNKAKTVASSGTPAILKAVPAAYLPKAKEALAALDAAMDEMRTNMALR